MRIVIPLISLFISLSGLAQVKKQRAEEFYNQGILAMGSGNFEEARSLLTKSIAEDPGFAEAYATRAAVCERLSDFNMALRDYTISLEFIPDQFEVLLSRGALRFQLNQYILAQDDFKRLLRLPPGETNTIYYRQSAHSPGTDQILTAQGAIQSQVYNYLGLIETQLMNCPASIQYFDSAIRLNTSEADYYINRAMAKQACGEASTDEDFQKALTINPDHPIAKHNLASLSARKGDFNTAERQLTEAIEADPLMLDPYLERAYYRLLRKDYAGALADYSQAIKLDRANPEIWLNRGMAKEKLHDLAGAFRDYTEAIELDEGFVKAWLNRGNILAAQKKYTEAIEDYSAAITYQPDYGVAYYNRAIAYYKLNKLAEACDDLKNAARLNYPIEERITKSFCRNH
ncbi:MAG: tetratricopeptide repeat protein [Cyclobacteriaceae bacterium]|nr:tetratricopeptide repeat protein [Cyclobacteriaceae bacterium]UYN85212.1 MAG: tetratricopeptide repeat protein [Cyclobacteriaceae bacterium]